MEEIWKLKCKIDLRNLRKNEAAIKSLPEDIAMERQRMTSIKSAASGSIPVSGGGNRYEDRLNNSICLIDMLTDNLYFAEKEVDLLHKAFELLTKEEQHLLISMYVDRQKDAISRLCEELFCDERTVWRKVSQALESYCRARYGC